MTLDNLSCLDVGSRIMAPDETAKRTPDGYERVRFHNGLMVWAVAIVIVGYPEIKAAWNPPDWASPHWHTISSTVGHLEQFHHWVALIVVGFIVVVTAYGVRFPPPLASETMSRRSPSGRLLPPNVSDVDRGTPSYAAGLIYLGFTTIIVVGAGYLVSRSSAYASYRLEYVMYGLLGVFVFVMPLVAAWLFSTEVPFTTIFTTARRLERKSTLLAIVLLGLFVILVIHLALYPWPNYSHLPPATPTSV